MTAGGRELLLLPHPRQLVELGGRVADAEPNRRHDASLPAQGYRIEATADGVTVWAPDAAGRRHAAATLAQLRHRANAPDGVADGRLPACAITDWPDHAVRGVMLDISRDKVPTLETLRAVVDRLAALKVNHLQLYMEHTFAYEGHEEVWRDADPLTAADLAEVERHCAASGVELAANQNTLGHFERWLRLDRYRPLAIAPDGFDWLFGIHRAPCTLNPARRRSFELVTDLLGQLLAHLDSHRVHVGLDEPWELPPERSAEWGAWLRRLRALPVMEGRELLVWGDVPAAHPELLDSLPDAVTVCDWGYETWHPFAERVARLVGGGHPVWVCPGTSSWMSVGGRTADMLGNVAAAATAGSSGGAAGFLLTDWGDCGHHQYLPVSEPGFAAGAAMSWCASTNALDAERLSAALDGLVFDDDAPGGGVGRAVVDLGRVAGLVTPHPPNMSPLVAHLLFPQWPVGIAFTTGMTTAELDTVDEALDAVRARLAAARPRRADAALAVAELGAAADWLSLGAADARLRLRGDGHLRSVDAADRAALERRAAAVAETHATLWRARNREGGLADSLAWLEHLRAAYRSGTADPGWFGPLG